MQPFDNNKDIETQLLKNNRQSRFSSFTYVRPSDLDPSRALQSDTIFGRLEKAYPDKIGFYYLIFSIVFMSLNAYFTKVAGVLPVPEIAFLRSLFMMIGIYIFITRYQSDLDIGDKRYKKVVIVLCLLGFPTALSYIYGVVHIQLAEAVTVMISTPIFVSIFSWFIFAQHFKKEQLISIVLWIIGITLVMNSAISSDSASIEEIPSTTPVTNEAGETVPTTPSTETETAVGNNQFKAVVICLINALLTASSSVVVKATNVKIPPIVLMTFGTLTNLVFSGILCLATGFKIPEFESWINVMGLGFLYFYGQFFLMKSLEHASTRVNAALINNVQILLIYIIQMIFMAEFPAFWSFVGTLFVVGACVVLASLNR